MDTARLFVGLPLPGAYQDGLTALACALKALAPAPCAWTRPGEWHLTLKFLGDTPLERVPALSAALAAVSWSAFALRAGGAGTFPPGGRPRVLWAGLALGGEACAALAARVEEACAPLGFPREGRAFAAHLTVARIKGGAPLQAWRPALEALGGARWPEIEADRLVLWRSFAAGEKAAVRSAGGSRPPGPRHVPLWEGGAPG